ncbi:L,D-transpeptidase family protein [Aurantibacillus circumpalustris]|uniref:L,D-transpeptidase family protein n=1 Tax=Aurantibacillus circumpalustris TaxID=3036359 RepID=UPI00295B327C|nr:L,D-transpeptidase family protein [Aurantibacillus circumpalustris]
MIHIKKIINTCLLACISILLSFQNLSFKDQQLKNNRVKKAYASHWATLQNLLVDKQINKSKFDLYIRVFKQEGVLEAWVKNKTQNGYTLLKNFSVCAKSGALGPKRKQGDGQVPEGFYEISAFQPNSSYHLALKVSYPNKSDHLKTTASDPGGDIMIHGNCVTIGCIPIQDEPIEELYVLAVEAKNNSSSVYSDIYPFRFNENNRQLLENCKPELQEFWKNLKSSYENFESKKVRLQVTVDSKGNYTFNSK